MNLPEELSASVEDAVGISIIGATPVSGGDINDTARVDSSDGRSYFLKSNRSAGPGMFEAEVDGLSALANVSGVRVPQPLAHGVDDKDTAWLLMEYIIPGAATPSYQESLGQGLAAVHRQAASKDFGWDRDNWIGSLPQSNAATATWPDFWRDQRIAPQLDLARQQGLLTETTMDQVLEVIPAALRDITEAGLVHGDLWSGNTYAAEDGTPVLIDPAVYRGHGEVDLAMSELFGGFGQGFYDAYDSVTPISDEYEVFRRDLYQLYFLLVHVNLFGASYVPASLAATRRVVAGLA